MATLSGFEQLAITFVLAVFRIAAMMLFAPVLGSSRIPRRVRGLMALVLTLGVLQGVKPVTPPSNVWALAVGIGGEILFGLAMGTVLSLTFIAVQWAGEMIGQQMGFNISEVFDPQFGSQGSLVGDLYFMLALCIFLAMGAHREMIRGVHDSFTALPLLSVGVNAPLLQLITGLLTTATNLAIKLAAPTLVTMLVTDLVLGLLGRAMPQLNVMAAGQSIKALIGIILIVLGLMQTNVAMQHSILDALTTAMNGWRGVGVR